MEERSKEEWQIAAATVAKSSCPSVLDAISKYSMEDLKINSLKCLSARCAKKSWGRCKVYKDMKIDAEASASSGKLTTESPSPSCLVKKDNVVVNHLFGQTNVFM